MLNRLISNLPFNPGLIEDLSLYGKKLRAEQTLRRLGFIMILLGMVVQLYAALSPPEKSLVYAADNIVENGVRTKKDILQAWDAPNSDIPEIYGKFKVTRNDISNLSDQPDTVIKSDASNLWIVNRKALTGHSGAESSYPEKEIAIKTEGTTVYLRPLTAWDSGHSRTYKAFSGKLGATGETFWILEGGGSYVQNGTGRLPAPRLEIRSSIVGSHGNVKPGDSVKLRIEYRNSQDGSLAEDVKISGGVELAKLELTDPGNLTLKPDGKFEKNLGNLPYSDQSNIFDIGIKIKNNLKNEVSICGSAKLSAANLPSATDSAEACMRISDAIIRPAANTAKITQIPPGVATEVKNITQNLNGQAAMDSTLNPGDLIEYDLLTYNGRTENIKDYQITDYVGDMLDYGDLDQAFLAQEGATYDSKTKEIKWTGQNLASNQDNIKKFRVKIKSPVPNTNRPASTSASFDCKISNQYGNEISLDLRCPIAKTIESEPNITPYQAIGAAFGLVFISGYILARNSLIRKELSILKRDVGR